MNLDVRKGLDFNSRSFYAKVEKYKVPNDFWVSDIEPKYQKSRKYPE